MIYLIIFLVVYGVIELLKIYISKNDVLVNMTMNTEANEQVQFSFKLHKDLDKDTMVTKINKIFEVSEQRRTFQYDRIEKIRKKAIEDAELLNEKESKVSVLHSKKD